MRKKYLFGILFFLWIIFLFLVYFFSNSNYFLCSFSHLLHYIYIFGILFFLVFYLFIKKNKYKIQKNLISIGLFFIFFIGGVQLNYFYFGIDGFLIKKNPITVKKSYIYFHNILISNKKINQVVKEALKYDPEIIFLVENVLEVEKYTGKKGYVKLKEQKNKKYNFNGGCNFFIKEGFEKNYIFKRINITDNYSICYLLDKEKDVTIYGIHPIPPWNKSTLKNQIDLFIQLKKELLKLDQNNKKFILLGDFNVSYYSKYFRDILGKWYIKSSISWDSRDVLGFSLFVLAIDQVLTNIKDLNFHYGKNIGSDHKYIVIDFFKIKK